jgi:hypothetical protein
VNAEVSGLRVDVSTSKHIRQRHAFELGSGRANAVRAFDVRAQSDDRALGQFLHRCAQGMTNEASDADGPTIQRRGPRSAHVCFSSRRLRGGQSSPPWP